VVRLQKLTIRNNFRRKNTTPFVESRSSKTGSESGMKSSRDFSGAFAVYVDNLVTLGSSAGISAELPTPVPAVLIP